MTPDLVIFDCDGVLVDSEPITNRIMAQEMTDHGLPMQTHEAIDLFVGGTILSVFEKARAMGARLPDNWVDGFYDRMINTLADEVAPIEGAHDLMDALDNAGIAYCVASNGPMRKMEVTLTRTGLWDRVEGRIHSAHTVGLAKPDPGLFLHAARTHQAPPQGCLVIEDSASGARAAQAAGMRCFGLTRDTPAEKLLPHGAEPVARLSMIPALIGLHA